MPSETCSSQLGSQAGDRVSSLISKMMISNQVNILGEGYGFFDLQIIRLCTYIISLVVLAAYVTSSLYIAEQLGELRLLEIINGFCRTRILHVLIHQRYGLVYLIHGKFNSSNRCIGASIVKFLTVQCLKGKLQCLGLFVL